MKVALHPSAFILQPFKKGVRGESNPPPRRSQRRMPDHYTTDTISSERKERESNPQGWRSTG